MEFKYSISILFSHMGYVLKILVWLLLCLLITAAIGAAIFVPIYRVLRATTELGAYVGTIKTTVIGVWNGSFSMRSAIGSLVSQIIGALNAISKNAGVTVGLVFAIIFLYCLYSFLVGLSYYAIGDIINKLMASNLRFGFASNMALNFKKCCKYSLAKLSIALPIDIIFVSVMLAIFLSLFGLIGYFTVPITIVLFVLFCSLRALLFSGWLPRYLHHPNTRVFANLSRSFPNVRANIRGLFKSYVITFSIVYILASLLTMPTGGLILLILPSIYYFQLRAVELVGYYKTKGYSFYTDGITVINTVEYGFRKDNQESDEEEYQAEPVAEEHNEVAPAEEVVADVNSIDAQISDNADAQTGGDE